VALRRFDSAVAKAVAFGGRNPGGAGPSANTLDCKLSGKFIVFAMI